MSGRDKSSCGTPGPEPGRTSSPADGRGRPLPRNPGRDRDSASDGGGNGRLGGGRRSITRDVMADGRGPRARRRRGRARRRAARAAELVHGVHARRRSRGADRRPSPRRRRRGGDADHPPRVGLAATGGRGRRGGPAGPRRRDPRHGVADRRRPLDRDGGRSRDGGRGRRQRGRPLSDHAGAEPAPSARALAARTQGRLPRGDSRRTDAVRAPDGQRRRAPSSSCSP